MQTLRAVIDIRGQRVSAADRLYLLQRMPMLVCWGERDRTIPIGHGRAAQAQLPGSRFVTLPRAAHFPHLEDPEGLARELDEFIDATDPAAYDEGDWQEILCARSGTAPRRRPSA